MIMFLLAIMNSIAIVFTGFYHETGIGLICGGMGWGAHQRDWLEPARHGGVSLGQIIN